MASTAWGKATIRTVVFVLDVNLQRRDPDVRAEGLRLLWVMGMAAVGQGLQRHLTAQLNRVG